MAGSKLIIGALTLAALAGCLDSGQPSDLPDDIVVVQDEQHALPPDLRLVDCRADSYSFYVTASDVRDKIPPEYEIWGSWTKDLVPIHLDVKSCASVVLDNETVISPASLAFTRARVRVNESLSNDVDFHSYLIEGFQSDPRLVSVFAAAGLPATLADIRLEGTPPTMTFKVDVGGSVWYEGSVLGGVPTGAEWAQSHNMHAKDSEGRASWVESRTTVTNDFGWAQVVLKPHHGFLSSAGTGPQGVQYGDSGPGTSRGTFHFAGL